MFVPTIDNCTVSPLEITDLSAWIVKSGKEYTRIGNLFDAIFVELAHPILSGIRKHWILSLFDKIPDV